MKTRRFWGAAAGALALLAAAATADACTRAVYLGRDGLVITGRTMDWKEEIGTNLYLFPRGMERAGDDRARRFAGVPSTAAWSLRPTISPRATA